VARNAIGELSFEHGAIFKEYASTLLSIAISPISGNYILIHIGDGCAICVLNDKSIKMLDPPEYCFTQPYTWLTTSATAANHVKVRMGNTKQMRRIILLSDGASTLCYGKNIRPKGVHLFAEEPFSSTLLYLQNHKSNDDVTCIFLDLKADLMAE